MIICHDADGRIANVIFDPVPEGAAEHLAAEGVAHIVVDSPLSGVEIVESRYVKDGKLKPRPAVQAVLSKPVIAADDTDECIVSGLPRPVIVKVDGVAHEVKSSKLRLTSTVPATYRLEIDQWPFLPWSAEVVAQ